MGGGRPARAELPSKANDSVQKLKDDYEHLELIISQEREDHADELKAVLKTVHDQYAREHTRKLKNTEERHKLELKHLRRDLDQERARREQLEQLVPRDEEDSG